MDAKTKSGQPVLPIIGTRAKAKLPTQQCAEGGAVRTSRKLIAESRERIVSGKNILAF
jgi:hypothetical protein